MGLDMYARIYKVVDTLGPVKVKPNSDISEIHYWRKHHDLHGWMHKLYLEKGGTKEFNCEYVNLDMEDLDRLEKDLKMEGLPPTTGFFFGNNPPDEDSLEDDMEFIRKARDEIRQGRLVYYSSWW
jgi:hypothetical protein